jgi:hypothetical protein
VAGFARAGGLLVATLTVPDDVEETVAVLFVLVILLTVDVVLPVVADTLFVPTNRVPDTAVDVAFVPALTVPPDVEETVAVLFVLATLLTVDVVLPVVADTLFVPTSRVP